MEVMKTFIKLGIVSGFVAAGAFFVFSNTATANAANATEALTSPRSLFVNNCASCHGSDGKAQTAKGRQLDADDITGGVSTSKTIRLVTNGKGDMPSFKKRLTAAQIRSIAGYVKTL